MLVDVVTHGFSPSFDVLLKLDSKRLINFRKTGSFKTAEDVTKTWHIDANQVARDYTHHEPP